MQFQDVRLITTELMMRCNIDTTLINIHRTAKPKVKNATEAR